MSRNDLSVRIGSRMRALRKNKGLSQEELAGRIGKSTETVSNIERGVFLPRIDTAEEIANALEVPMYELFVHDISINDKTKITVINEIIGLLKNQPLDLLKTTLEQVKSFIALKDSFIDRLNK